MGEGVLSSVMETLVQETGLKTELTQSAENNRIMAAAGSAEATAAAGTSSPAVVRWDRFLPKMSVRVLLVEADDSTRQIIAALLRKCSYRVAAVCDGLKAWEVLKERSHNIDLILTEVELPSISGYALLTLIMEHDVCKNIPVIMMSSNDSVSTVYKCMLRGAADFLVKPVRKNELRNLWQHVWRRQASRSSAGPGPPPDESVAQQKVEATAENNAVSNNNNSSGYLACVQRNRECIEKGSDAQSSCTKPEMETEGASVEQTRCHSDEVNIYTQEQHDHQQSREPENWSRQAIDLIGTFDNHLKDGTLGRSTSNSSINKFDILHPLDLSLRRSYPSSSVNQVNDETKRLNHSDASAFSRYINKPQNSTSPHETNSDACGQTMFAYPQPIPVRLDNIINGLGSMMPHSYCKPSASQQFHNLIDQSVVSNAIDQTDNNQGCKMDNLEDHGHINHHHHHSMVSMVKVVSECGNDEGAPHRAILREAALSKFRLKRKERCFEKKVRYESRKKLAEQRPRVKGQFVRQAPEPGSSSAS